MKIREVHPARFICWCTRCGMRLEKNIPKWADLDGEPWVAYYCHECLPDNFVEHDLTKKEV
jgi:hypothetical protein